MNKDINLVEILKDAPKGTKLWSPICGECKLINITSGVYPIGVSTEKNNSQTFTFMSNGWYADYPNAECLLFPSKENRDWRTFKASYNHKHFEPYQKVLVASEISNTWEPDVYRLYDVKRNVHSCMHYYTIRKDNQIIPYEGNEDKLGKSVK